MKNKFEHLMLKEIFEQTEVMENTIEDKINGNNEINFKNGGFTSEEVKNFNRIYIAACGTAFHAGLSGKIALERFTGIPVKVNVASEFRYEQPVIDGKTLAIFISQSGETADTLSSLALAKSKGATILVITNVENSTMAKQADKVIYTMAGPELSIASTKAYTNQVLMLYLLALDMGNKNDYIDNKSYLKILEEIKLISAKITEILDDSELIKPMAKLTTSRPSVYFLGRYLDYVTAKEASLKLKETSYIHAESFPAGEFKHGPIALIEDGTPVVLIATQDELVPNMITSLKDVKANGAKTITVIKGTNEEISNISDYVISLPYTMDLLTPLISIIPLQLLAYYTALELGNDVDKPRNLTKAVVIE
ncbi:MAG: isomerizing glutamine--fructose-6-phosphate transaminase [Tissierellia bacterium]|nr:isomerizing glutamine--fructose-6-phosphate transaminase [Tissierellia bacterium]